MFLANGFDDFLSKPIELSQLTSILEKWVPKKKQKRSSKNAIETTTSAPIVNKKHDSNPLGMDIEGIDIRTGIAWEGENIDNYVQALNLFQQEWSEKIYAIKTALDINEFDLFTTYLRELKGKALHLGAVKISEMAESLERASNKDDTTFIQDNIDDLFSMFNSTLASIRTAIRNYRDDANASLDISLLRTALVTLKSAIKQEEPHAIYDTAKEIRHFLHTPGIGGNVEGIIHHALAGEYREATSEINFLLQEEKND